MGGSKQHNGAGSQRMAMDHWGDFDKLHTALKYYLVGKEYHTAIKAMYYASRLHTGLRKDGHTREFHHQLEIGMHISTLRGLENEELCIAAAMLHDVMEDYDVSRGMLETEFDAELVHIVWLLTRKYNGLNKDLDSYFHEITHNPVASIVKGVDRIHNVQTMVGVFNLEKQRRYIFEVEQYFIPMLKQARYIFSRQGAAYANIEKTLRSQIELIEAVHLALQIPASSDAPPVSSPSEPALPAVSRTSEPVQA